jgi:hypothetical protein
MRSLTRSDINAAFNCSKLGNRSFTEELTAARKRRQMSPAASARRARSDALMAEIEVLKLKGWVFGCTSTILAEQYVAKVGGTLIHCRKRKPGIIR